MTSEVILPSAVSGVPPSARRWKPYPAYRDSGVEWLEKIPEHWRMRRLKFVAPSSTSKLTEKPPDAPYIALEHVESGTGRLLL